VGVGEAEFQAGLRPYILVRPRCHVKDEGSCTLLPQFVIPNRAEGAVRNLLLGLQPQGGIWGPAGIRLCTCGTRKPSTTMQVLSTHPGGFSAKQGKRGNRATAILPALQARDRIRRQIRSRLHVRADGRRKAAPKVGSPAHLLLPAMFRLPGHGHAARRSPEFGRLGDDPRNSQRRALAKSSRLGEPPRRNRPAPRTKARTQTRSQTSPPHPPRRLSRIAGKAMISTIPFAPPTTLSS
jgi:hypothetical protein